MATSSSPLLFRALFIPLLVCCPIHGQEPSENEQKQHIDPVDALVGRIEEIVEQENIPGLGVALVADGEVVLQRAFGMADIEGGRLADIDTLWRIGSTSKVFVSMSMLNLQERGVLELSDTLSQHAPDIPFKNRWESSDPIRIVHLLEQSTGFDDMHPNEGLIDDADISLFDALTFNPRSRTSRWKPGAFATYSNVNAAVAAYIVEKRSGESYESFVRDQVFAPLDMKTADFFLTRESEPILAKGYRYVDERLEPVDYWHIPFRPSGSVNASIRELTNLLQFFLNRGEFDGKQVLDEKSIERMEQVTSTLAAQNGLEAGYGATLMVRPMMGYTWYGHTGVMDGYQAGFFYLPRHRVGLVATMNEKNPRVYGKVTNAMLRHLISQLPQREPRSVVQRNREELDALTGTYRAATSRQGISHAIRRLGVTTLVVEDNHLQGKNLLGQVSTFTPAGNSLFYENKRRTPTVVHFDDQSGRHYYQREGFETMVRVSPWVAWGELSLAVTVVVLFASTLLYSLVTAVVWLTGRFTNAKHWHTRLFPVYAMLCLFVAQRITAWGGANEMARAFTWGGLTAYLLGWCFFLLSCCGLVAVVLSWKKELAIHSAIKTYLFCVCSANVALMLYVFCWMTWLPNWVY